MEHKKWLGYFCSWRRGKHADLATFAEWTTEAPHHNRHNGEGSNSGKMGVLVPVRCN